MHCMESRVDDNSMFTVLTELLFMIADTNL